MREYEENHRDRLCSFGAKKSIPSVLLLDEQNTYFGGRRVLEPHPNPPAAAEHVPSSSFQTHMLCSSCRRPPLRSPLMEWVTPQHEEIDLNCEISSYANAEL
jgi:hypothetical protein